MLTSRAAASDTIPL